MAGSFFNLSHPHNLHNALYLGYLVEPYSQDKVNSI